MSDSAHAVSPEASAGGRLDRDAPGGAPAARGVQMTLPGAPPARYRLLWEEAPATCAAVVSALPPDAECFHAIYSGTVAAFLLPPDVAPPLENATTCLVPGDLVFTHYDAGFRYGHLNALSEIYWPYDRHARPTVPGQFVPLAASVFAAYEGDEATWRAFADRCQRLRFDGTCRIAAEAYG